MSNYDIYMLQVFFGFIIWCALAPIIAHYLTKDDHK